MLLGALDPLMMEAAQRVIAALVHRLGGEVTITEDELKVVDPYYLDAKLDIESMSMSISYKPAVS